MKSRKTRILEKVLKNMAKAVLKKYQPKIVAVTGSVGKTTTKEAIATALAPFIFTRKSEKNFNNEIGVPLAIIGSYPQKYSPIEWLAVFLRWLKLMLLPQKYPQVLILEMGADRPGDIKYLCSFVPLSVGVLTNVGISHLEYFRTKEKLLKEKSDLLKCLPTEGLGVYNYDDEEVRAIEEKIKANVLSYGFQKGAKMRATDIFFDYQKGSRESFLHGITFKLNYQGKIIPVSLPHCVGRPHIYAALAAFSVGVYFDLNLIKIAEALKSFRPLPGRMALLRGIKRTMLVDDTYNSAPDSLRAALEVLKQIAARKRIVALGDMLELGKEEAAAHYQAGQEVALAKSDYFIAVGKRMAKAQKGFIMAGGVKENFIHFDDPMEAGRFIQNLLQPGDVVLIKGSQGMRMEKVVEEIMANPTQKEQLLVRQTIDWKTKPYRMP